MSVRSYYTCDKCDKNDLEKNDMNEMYEFPHNKTTHIIYHYCNKCFDEIRKFVLLNKKCSQ